MNFQSITALCIDLDGVLYVGDSVIPGAVETLEYLKAKGIRRRFVTNTTTKSLETLHTALLAKGLPVERGELINAPYAAVLHLRGLGNPRCHLVLTDDAKKDFAEFEQTDTNPDVVVIGDIGAAWNYSVLNSLFRMLLNGAQLVALHRERFWRTETGLQLDIGAFVVGLEYAAGVQATIVGKPALPYYQLALADMGAAPETTAMIGDDLRSDIGGAQNAGLRGILVRTGKFRQQDLDASDIVPDLVINSIADLPSYL